MFWPWIYFCFTSESACNYGALEVLLNNVPEGRPGGPASRLQGMWDVVPRSSLACLLRGPLLRIL